PSTPNQRRPQLLRNEFTQPCTLLISHLPFRSGSAAGQSADDPLRKQLTQACTSLMGTLLSLLQSPGQAGVGVGVGPRETGVGVRVGPGGPTWSTKLPLAPAKPSTATTTCWPA